MSARTLELAIQRVRESPWVDGELTICWHAGEPLAVPLSFYEAATSCINSVMPKDVIVTHSVVTNATPLSDKWCRFLKDHAWQITVSIDGPALLHDRYRVTRAGRGSHDQAMRGISLLRRHGVQFSTIAVVTASTLPFADEMFWFFANLGTRAVCFNFEEQENHRQVTSLGGQEKLAMVSAFLNRFFDLCDKYKPPFVVRELEVTKSALRAAVFANSMRPGAEAWPFDILSIDWTGNVSTFSPELMGERTVGFGDWSIGNISDGPLEGLARTRVFRRQLDAIYAGINRCRDECGYYVTCGGSSPSNKLGENGSVDSTETQFCRIRSQLLPEIVLQRLGASIFERPGRR